MHEVDLLSPTQSTLYCYYIFQGGLRKNLVYRKKLMTDNKYIYFLDENLTKKLWYGHSILHNVPLLAMFCPYT